MKQYIRYIPVVVLLLCSTVAFARGNNVKIADDIANNVTYSIESGAEGIVVTLTVTPSDGFYLESIRAEKTVDASAAARRRADIPVGGEYALTKTSASADRSQVATYTLNLEGEFGAYVTASFKPRTEITAEQVALSAGSFTYSGSDQKPAVSVEGLTLDTDYAVTYAETAWTNVGTYTVIVTGIDTYMGAQSKTWAIGPKEATVKTGSASREYDGTALTNAETDITGLVGGETVTVTATGSQTDVGSSDNTYTIDWGNIPSGNYSITDDLGTLTITPKAVTVTADNQTKVYGTDDPELTAAVDGTIGEDKVTYVLNRAEGENVGEYTITPSGDVEQGNYTVSYTTATLTITAATLTDIVATPYSGTYDGAAHSIEVTIPEGASIKYGTAEGTYDMDEAPDYTNVGTYTIFYQVTKDNYNAVTGSQTVTINSKSVTVTADNQTKVYGTADPELTAAVDGTIGEDEVTYVLNRAEGENVGEYAITPSGETEQGNYTVSYTNATLTITPATLTDITATAYEGTYDGAAHTIEVTIPEGAVIKYGTVEGTYDMDEAPSYTNVGTYTTYYQVTKDNYNAVTGSQTVTISAKAVTVTADDQTKVYGTADPELTAVVDGTIGEDVVTFVLNRAEGEDVGEYAITPSGETEQGNYTVSYTNGTLEVTPATMAVTAESYEGIYDGAAHGITVNGIPEGSTVTYGETAEACTLADAPTLTNVGEKTIYYKVVNGNYNDAAGSAVITISPKEATVTTGSASREYDGTALTNAEADITGLVDGETVTVTVTGSQTDVGSSDNTYTIDWGNTLSGNYTITDDLGTLEVTPATMAVTAESYEGIYDCAAHGITVNGIPEGSTVTYGETAEACTLADAPTLTNVGEKTVYYKVVNGNYNDAAGSATITISPKEATVTTGSASREYDGTALTNAETDITGLVDGETVTVTVTGSQTDVGSSDNTYTIDWGNTLSGNYSITDDLGTLEVTPKAVTVTADNQTKVYGTADPELTAIVDGTIGEDEITYVLSRAEGENVGEYAITPSGETEQGNYTVSYTVATLTITAATLTDITATPYSGTYDGIAHTIEVTIPEGAAIKYGTAEGTYDMDEAPDYINVGTYTIYYQVTKDNFNAATGSQTVTINSKSVTVTADNQTKVYGTADPELTAAVDGTIGEDKVTYVLNRAEGENVGEYAITPSGETEQGNYTVSYTAATLTITPATMTDITATAYEGIYDGAAHTIEVTIPEGAAIKYGTAEGTYDMDEAPEYTNVGTYTIYYQVTKDNYNAATGSQTVTISAKAVTVIADDQTKVYGTDDPELTAAVDGTIGEDKVTYVLNRAEGENVGEYTITPSGDVEQGNYTVSYTTATLTITAATLTDIVATPYSGTYDGAAHSIEVTIPEGASIKYGTAEGTYDMDEAPEYTNVGTYTIFYQVTKDNYNAVIGSQTVTINSKAVTVTADNQTKVYGTADPELTAAVDGTIGEDKVTYSLSRAEGEDVGEYTITPTGDAEQGNYTVSYTVATLTITAATINYSGGTIQMDENGYDVSLAENTGSANPLPISGTVDDLDYGRVLVAPGNGEGEMTIDNEPVNLYTVCLPFDPRTGTGVKYYTLSSVDGTTLKFTEVETAPAAFTPYLVAVSGSSNIIESCTNVTFETSHAINSTTVDGFTFSGTLTGLSNADARTAAGGSGKATYILQDNAKWGKVVNGNVYLPPFRGYVTGPDLNTGNARELASSFGGDATGIRNIRTIDADGTEHWYDLNGRRIDKPTQKGIYILNGRKEVIR